MDEATRVRPLRAGAVPLLLGLGTVQGVAAAAATVGAGEPAVPLVTLPDCGCDACDHGSVDLLDEFDEHAQAVVTGDLVHVAAGGGVIVATDDGWHARSIWRGPQIEAVLAEARAGRSPHRVVQGPPWA